MLARPSVVSVAAIYFLLNSLLTLSSVVSELDSQEATLPRSSWEPSALIIIALTLTSLTPGSSMY